MNSSNPQNNNVDPLVSAGIAVLVLTGVLWQIGDAAFHHPEGASPLGTVLAVLWQQLQGWGYTGGDLGVAAFFLIAIALGLAAAVVVLLFLWLCRRLGGGGGSGRGQKKNEV